MRLLVTDTVTLVLDHVTHWHRMGLEIVVYFVGGKNVSIHCKDAENVARAEAALLATAEGRKL